MSSDPSPADAKRFALLLHAGVPAAHAVAALLPDLTPERAQELAGWWTKHGLVLEEIDLLQGGVWETLPQARRIELALQKHYAELAYTLMVHHYSEVSPMTRGMLDTARRALEAYLAGTSGRADPLAELYKTLVEEKQRDKLETLAGAAMRH